MRSPFIIEHYPYSKSILRSQINKVGKEIDVAGGPSDKNAPTLMRVKITFNEKGSEGGGGGKNINSMSIYYRNGPLILNEVVKPSSINAILNCMLGIEDNFEDRLLAQCESQDKEVSTLLLRQSDSSNNKQALTLYEIFLIGLGTYIGFIALLEQGGLWKELPFPFPLPVSLSDSHFLTVNSLKALYIPIYGLRLNGSPIIQNICNTITEFINGWSHIFATGGEINDVHRYSMETIFNYNQYVTSILPAMQSQVDQVHDKMKNLIITITELVGKIDRIEEKMESKDKEEKEEQENKEKDREEREVEERRREVEVKERYKSEISIDRNERYKSEISQDNYNNNNNRIESINSINNYQAVPTPKNVDVPHTWSTNDSDYKGSSNEFPNFCTESSSY